MGATLHGLDPKKLRNWVIVGVIAVVLLLFTGSLFSAAPSAAPAATQGGASTTTAGGGGQGSVSSILAYQQQLQDNVQVALAGIRGAGKVQVTISLRGGPSFLYVFNQTSRVSHSGSGTSQSQDTTTENQLATAGGSQSPVLTQELAPKVAGALVIASGASDPTVRAELLQAAEALLGLPAYEIQVLPGGGGY